IQREETGCGEPIPGTTDCRGVYEALQNNRACADLLDTRVDPPASRPKDLRDQQLHRASELFQCVAPAGPYARMSDPLVDGQAGRVLDALYAKSNAAEQRMLVCLSWAGSIEQGHKDEGWGLAQALRFGFEPSATFGAMAVDLQEPAAGAAPSASGVR